MKRNLNLILAVGVLSQFQSFAQWTNAVGYNTGGVYSISTIPGGMIAGYDGGLLTSWDNGSTWVNQADRNHSTTYTSVKKLEYNNDQLYTLTDRNNFKISLSVTSITTRTVGESFAFGQTLGFDPANEQSNGFFFSGIPITASSKGLTFNYGNIYQRSTKNISWGYCGEANAVIVHNNTLFAGTKNGIFKMESDSSFTRIVDGLSNYHIYAFAIEGNTLLAATYDGIFKKESNNDTWSSAGLSGRTIFSLVVNNGTWFAGTENGVYYSTNKGAEWKAMSNNLPNDTYVNTIYLSGDRIFIGTGSQGIWYADISNLFANEGTINSSGQSSLSPIYSLANQECFVSKVDENIFQKKIEIYPNPVSSGNEILFATGFNGTFSVAVLDLMGNIVKQYSSVTANTALSTSGISSGLYLLQFKSGSNSILKKLVVQ